jgi:hypothetical protein
VRDVKLVEALDLPPFVDDEIRPHPLREVAVGSSATWKRAKRVEKSLPVPLAPRPLFEPLEGHDAAAIATPAPMNCRRVNIRFRVDHSSYGTADSAVYRAGSATNRSRQRSAQK